MRGLTFDTMVAAYLLESAQRSLGLKDLAWTRLKVEMESYAELAGKGKAALTLDRVPIERVARYSCADADVTLRLKQDLQPELEAAGLELALREGGDAAGARAGGHGARRGGAGLRLPADS